MPVTTIGLDLAKHVFQVHGVDARGRPLIRKRLRREEVRGFFAALPPCLVGMEACPSAHHWARELAAFGHRVRLMPPRYVRPYVKTNKNDAADAEAICEAVTRPNMRFVPVKDADRQSVVTLHRVRELLIRQRTQTVNARRGHLAEFGVVAPKGVARLRQLTAIVMDPEDTRVPGLARRMLNVLVEQLQDLQRRLAELEDALILWARSSDACRRLMTVPGIGAVTATALVASTCDPGAFRSGRHFAAWLGLVPKQHSTGGRDRLGSISKRGDGYLRKLLVHGSRAVMRWFTGRWPWLDRLRRRRPANVVVVAVANKRARIAWALMRHGGTYRGRMPIATA